MDNVPVLKKCCFCVPLRYGLLTWGYLKLAASLVGLGVYLFTVLIFIVFSRRDDNFIITIYLSLLGILLPTEIVLHIVFIIGAHKKNAKLLRLYYYYALFMWVVSIIMTIVTIIILILEIHVETGSIVLYVCSFVISLIVQTFLVLSLRSEIIKLRGNCPYRFIKNNNDPEGTINSAKNECDVATDNTTVRI